MYPCPRCNGKGVIDYYRFHAGGICFRCDGTGQLAYDPSAWSRRKRGLEKRKEYFRRKEEEEMRRHYAWAEAEQRRKEERRRKVMSVISDRRRARALLECLNQEETTRLDEAKTETEVREVVSALHAEYVEDIADILRDEAEMIALLRKYS